MQENNDAISVLINNGFSYEEAQALLEIKETSQNVTVTISVEDLVLLASAKQAQTQETQSQPETDPGVDSTAEKEIDFEETIDKLKTVTKKVSVIKDAIYKDSGETQTPSLFDAQDVVNSEDITTLKEIIPPDFIEALNEKLDQLEEQYENIKTSLSAASKIESSINSLFGESFEIQTHLAQKKQEELKKRIESRDSSLTQETTKPTGYN